MIHTSQWLKTKYILLNKPLKKLMFDVLTCQASVHFEQVMSEIGEGGEEGDLETGSGDQIIYRRIIL